MGSGHAALSATAPEVAAVLDEVVEAAWTLAASDGFLPTLVDAARRGAAIHQLTPLAPPGESTIGADTFDSAARDAVLTFALQSATDVSAMTAEVRSAFLAATGARAGNVAAALWVVDVVPRTRAALDTLFGPGPWPEPRTGAPPEVTVRSGDLWGALDGLIRTVPSLGAIDPVASELVRLRGARQHDCRLCRSIRSRPAVLAGADEALFANIDDYRHGGLTPLQQAALAFTDAMIWTPGRIGPDVVAELVAETTADQQVELVLDVTRNALNKVAVGLGADAPHVEDGVELYDVAPDGSLVYGVTLD